MYNNGTSDVERGWSNASSLVKHIHYLVLALLIIAVNACVIVTVWRNRVLRKWQNYLLVSLACSDLSTGLLGLPIALSCSYSTPQNVCTLCLVSYTFTKFLAMSTILHLLTVTYERFLFIVYPFHHERLSAKHDRFKLILAGIWVTSLAVALVPLTWSDLTQCSDSDNTRQWFIYAIITLIVFLFVPTVLFIFAFGSMFLVARVHIRKQEALITRQNRTQNSDSNAFQKEARVAVIFFLMWAIFVVCWTPYFVLNITEELGIEIELPGRLWEAASVLRFLTSFLNPLLYTFLKKDFCQALGLTCILRRSKCRGCCLPYNPVMYNARQEVRLQSNVTQRFSHLDTGHEGMAIQLSMV